MSEIDPELDAKWRAASSEEPPPSLDEAIRAAARREVGAKPGAFRAAPRWLPLAAAATVAAIAVGIVQMTPPEQVTPAIAPPSLETAQRNVRPEAEKATVDKAAPPLREAPAPAPPVPAPATMPPEAPRDAAKPLSKEQRRGGGAETDRDALARNRSDSFAPAPAPQYQEKKSLGDRQAAVQRAEEVSEREQTLKQKSEMAAAGSAAQTSPAASSATAPAKRNELRAFPAAPPPAESLAGNAPPKLAATPPPVAAAAPAPAPSSVPAAGARKLAGQSSTTGAVSGPLDAKDAANAEPFPNQDAGAMGKSAAADKVADERRKDATRLAPEEWIKRIRRLIAEGRREDAAKELVAFRREYKDRAESLLPSDLRAFKP